MEDNKTPGEAPRQERPEAPATAAVKRPGLKIALWVLSVLVGLPLAAALILCALALVFRSDPASYMPDGFSAYASLPSASAFVRDALHLKALDAALSAEGSVPLRGTVRSLRANAFLRSPLFMKLADVRVDAASYPGGFVIVADLGLRSALTRLAPLAARLFPGLLLKLPGLTYEPDAFPPRFEYRTRGMTVYAAFHRNVLVAASTPELLVASARPKKPQGDRALAKVLGASGDASLRFLADAQGFADGVAAGEGPLARLIASLAFPSLSVVDLTLSDQRVSLSANMPWTANDPGLEGILGRRSRTPSALTRLPASVSYFSLLAAGKPKELWTLASGFLGPDAASSFETADKAARVAFGMDLDTLLFSWMGGELGVLGSDLGPAPVFFASVENEKARKEVFEKAFESPLLGRDISAMVGDQRVPRIVFPRWMRSFLESLGVTLVEPFYLVEDGFIYLSASAETLAACVAESRSGKLLVKSDRWKSVAEGISPEASVMVYYTLDRSAPFFLRGSSGLAQALKLYRRGLAVLQAEKGAMRLELSAVTVGGPVAAELPGFPVRAKGRMSSDPVVGRNDAGAPMAYWTSGPNLSSMDLSSGATNELELDDAAWVALDLRKGVIVAVWAVSARGTVYRCDAGLGALPGFPALSGAKVSGPPAASAGSLWVPVSDDPSLMIVSPDGVIAYSDAMHARARTAPAAAPWGVAALPRSFDSALYLFGPDGALAAGWPVALPGIASAAPLVSGSAAEARVAALTESGQFGSWHPDGSPYDGFPVQLFGTFDAAPAWAPSLRSYFLVSAEGNLWRVGDDGIIQNSVPLARGGARGSQALAYDGNGDGREEIYVAGGGDALYAYAADLSPLPGYPVAGAGLPAFIDVDGDGKLDMITRGANDEIHAHQGGTP